MKEQQGVGSTAAKKKVEDKTRGLRQMLQKKYLWPPEGDRSLTRGRDRTRGYGNPFNGQHLTAFRLEVEVYEPERGESQGKINKYSCTSLPQEVY